MDIHKRCIWVYLDKKENYELFLRVQVEFGQNF